MPYVPNFYQSKIILMTVSRLHKTDYKDANLMTLRICQASSYVGRGGEKYGKIKMSITMLEQIKYYLSK